ncbi:MAG: alpha/beta fold hydrolase [Marinibacterium sp.]
MIEPLVLIPGLMCDARVFAHQVTDVSRDRAVMVALANSGERIEEIASNLLDQLPLRFAVAGHDLGGAIAIELLRRASDRITRICLIDSTPLAESPQEAAARDLAIVRARSGKLAEVMRDHYPFDALAPGDRRTALQDAVQDMAACLGPETYARQSRAMQRRRDQQSTLRKCRVPALILCGDRQSEAQIRHQAFLADLVPAAALSVVPRAGPLAMLEAPEATTRALTDWLAAPLVLR